jgi:hypothetical protein
LRHEPDSQTAGRHSRQLQGGTLQRCLQGAEMLGFVRGGQGSHRAFARPGEPELLNFQNRNGTIPPYQARQLITMIERYGNAQISD